MGFLSVRHNSHSTRGFPWAQTVVSGLATEDACSVCGVAPLAASGEIEIRLDQRKGSAWPDVLGCGHYPFFIVSERVIKAWEDDGIGVFPHHSVSILPPLPEKLRSSPSPGYVWLDGTKMCGASLDFEASGFVDVRFCAKCGRRTDNISATYDLQRSRCWPFAFVPGTWRGDRLFTTDLSPTKFFCTDDVLRSAARNEFTNFRFLSVEDGSSSSSSGIDYLEKRKANWFREGKAGGKCTR